MYPIDKPDKSKTDKNKTDPTSNTDDYPVDAFTFANIAEVHKQHISLDL
jgi:hypothetical protein